MSGETFQERAKGKDVRTSNIIAAKVSNNDGRGCRHLRNVANFILIHSVIRHFPTILFYLLYLFC
jgi:hypothetical protein